MGFQCRFRFSSYGNYYIKPVLIDNCSSEHLVGCLNALNYMHYAETVFIRKDGTEGGGWGHPGCCAHGTRGWL